MKNIFLLLLLTLNLQLTQAAVHTERKLAIIDLSARIDEYTSKLRATEHMAGVAGIPYDVITDINLIDNYPMAVIPVKLLEGDLETTEQESLQSYVQNGGILILCRLKDSVLFELCGVSGLADVDNDHHYRMIWDTTLDESCFRYINDAKEDTISLGRDDGRTTMPTTSYEVSGGTVLARFGDQSNAVVKNSNGEGTTYLFGVTFNDVVLRNLLNKDYSAQRTYSNGFEPTSDVFILMLKAIWQDVVPYAVTLRTVPLDKDAVLMITHDVDATTGMEMAPQFAEMEKRESIMAHYFVTTKYYGDWYAGAYYTPQFVDSLKKVLDNGQTMGSHSVGHFKDFYEKEIFPKGASGNTRDNYTPHKDGSDVATIGGTVYGELEVSKLLLENEVGINNVRSYRSGHLAFNYYQPEVLEELGYVFDSSNSANDVLTNFPYHYHYREQFSGDILNLLEIPMTVSDVIEIDGEEIAEDNYAKWSDLWLDITLRNADNGASTVLLVHPNRDYKISAIEKLLGDLPEGISAMNFEAFGDYWLAREGVVYESVVEDNVLTITVDSIELLQDFPVSFVVENGAVLNQIVVKDSDGTVLEQATQNVNGNTIVYCATAVIVSSEEPVSYGNIQCYPNPFTEGFFNISLSTVPEGFYTISIVDITGRILWKSDVNTSNQSVLRIDESNIGQKLSRGLYIVSIAGKEGIMTREKVVCRK